MRASEATPPSSAFGVDRALVQDLVDDCVHCGFCLPACPTYVLFGDEMDSPRGRIYLMGEALEGEPLTDAAVRHFDLCLGCLACVPACPSGVQYGKLIETTRHEVERSRRRALPDRLFRLALFRVLPYPRLLSVLAPALRLYSSSGLRSLLRRSGLLRLLPERLRALEALTPALPSGVAPPPALTAAVGPGHRRVGVLSGCVQRVFFPHVNAATVRVLAAEGCEVVVPRGQGCCGALSLHAGRKEEAMRFARRTIDVFEAAGVDNVVVNVAGCGSAMKEYGHLLRDDPSYASRASALAANVRDASELVDELGPTAIRHPLPIVAAYHDACHLAHGQGIRAAPRRILRSIPGLTLLDIRESEMCCGSAGIYNLVQSETAQRLGDRKAKHVLDTGAQMLITANGGCLLQIAASVHRTDRTLLLAHPMEVLDASIRGQPVSVLTGVEGSGAVFGSAP